MNLLDLIEHDHNLQRQLMRDIKATSGDSDERRELFRRLATELRAHAAAEEDAFYAELMKFPKSTDQSRHSVHEHEEALEILADLETMDMGSTGWLNRFEALVHDNEHHMDEEEQDVFPLARDTLDATRLAELGDRFSARKATELGITP